VQIGVSRGSKPESAARIESVSFSTRAELIAAALAGLTSIWRDGYRYKKAGVILLDLHPAAAVQDGLFDKADRPHRVVLMRTIDKLNLRFGRDTLSFAAAGRRDRSWKLRRELLSPCYTTAWDELLMV
jgi:DNA polymerase V